MLMEALAHDRANIRLWLNLAVVRRQLQDADGAFEALREALVLDNRNFPALLMQRGAARPASGRGVEAATPTASRSCRRRRTPSSMPPTRQAVTRAREVHAKHISELGRHIRERAAEAGDTARRDGAAADRVVHRHDASHPQAVSARSRWSTTTRDCRRSSSTSGRNFLAAGLRVRDRRRSAGNSAGSSSRMRRGSAPTFSMTSTCRSTSGGSSTGRRAGAHSISTTRVGRSPSAARARRQQWPPSGACPRRKSTCARRRRCSRC